MRHAKGLPPAVASFLGDQAAGEATVSEAPSAESAAERIAGGHAFGKHAADWEKLGIMSKQQLESTIRQVIENATGDDVKALSNGRIAYWSDSKNLVVIYNPGAADGGTVFRPDLGRYYFDEVLK